MLKLNMETFFRNNNYDEGQIEVVNELHTLLTKHTQTMDISEHAMNVMVHFKNRKNEYLEDADHFKKLVNKITQPLYKDVFKTEAAFTTPILDSIE